MITKEKYRIRLKGIIKYTYKKIGRAINDYQMISCNDRLLIAVSGGIDSLCLLNLLISRKARVPIDFNIIACFIETDFIKVNKEILIEYFKELKVEYVIKRLTLKEAQLDCFWCSWNRRKILFETARDFNCNKVVLGHNMDDIIETTLLNFFFNGEISTMKPKIELFGGKLIIIRPLCYIEKKDLISLASKFNFPDTQYECRYGKNSQRQMVREIIKSVYRVCPSVKKNIFRSLYRIKKDYLL
ncbi:MAG: hypothetical protein NC935_07745 [Candidatus Omnitrophica bacterium]|nr:hypothetical protein [Candidatus Omnitrophota bacterium]